MTWKTVKLKDVLKQYRITHLVKDDTIYKQVTISKHYGVCLRGEKQGIEIGRKRQFKIDLERYPNTLLMIRQGVQEGGIGIAPSEVHGCIATENMPMFSVENVEPDYLKHFLQSESFRQQLNGIQAVGSAQKAVHERELLKIIMPLPSRSEQIAFVKRMDKIEAYLSQVKANINRQLSTLADLRQSILREAVQGHLTARWREHNTPTETGADLLKRIKAHKQQLIAAGKLKKEKPLPPIAENETPFELPDGWVWCSLNEILDFNKSLSYGVLVPGPDVEDGVPFVRIQDLNEPYEGRKPNKSITPESESAYSKTRLDGGEILLGVVGATIGKLAVAPKSWAGANIARAICRIQPHSFVNLDYIFALLRSSHGQDYFRVMTRTLAQPTLNVGFIQLTPIPLPPLAEQQVIVERVAVMFGKVDALVECLNTARQVAEQLRQAVLREAFTPQVEVETPAD